MTIDHRLHYLEGLRSALSITVYPVQYLLSLPAETGEWLSEALTSRQSLEEENARLHEQQLLLNARLQTFAALESDNIRLRELLSSSYRVADRVLMAELLEVDLEPFSQQIIINKGSYHGVFEGQPLLDAKGVLGQVVHVSPFNSTVMLITDPSHAIPVWLNRNGLRAIAIGTGSSDRMELQYLPATADIVPGDLLITSGIGGHFPPGYPVATVESVDHDPAQPYAIVKVKPAAQLDRGREVLLIWPQNSNIEDAACANGDKTCEEKSPPVESPRPGGKP